MSVILPQSFVKPAMWLCNPGIVAYNCARLGLPIPWDFRAVWEKTGNKIFTLGGQERDGVFVVGEEPSWDNSKHGVALKFSGAQKISATENLSSLSANCSLMVLASCDTANPDYECAYNYRTNAGNNDLIGVFFDGATHIIHWWAGGGSGKDSPVGQWITSKLYCFIVTHNSAGDAKLYVDGRLIDSAVGKTWTTGANPIMYWGKYVANTFPLNGKISLSGLWNHTLTSSQVVTLYNNPHGLIESVTNPALWSIPPVGGVAPTSVFYGPLTGPLGGPI